MSFGHGVMGRIVGERDVGRAIWSVYGKPSYALGICLMGEPSTLNPNLESRNCAWLDGARAEGTS